MSHRFTLPFLLALISIAPGLRAADWPEAKRQAPADLAADIDRLVNARLDRDKITPSPLADDAEFLRRVSLDIVGKIPSAEQAAAFLDSREPDKRARLIDDLLADPAYGLHFGNTWHDQIIPRTPIDPKINPVALRDAFAEAFNANRPWGEVVSELVLCRNGTAERNFVAFYRVNGDMGGQPMANVAGRTFARLFLGLRMECAECHDDPFKPWKQDEFWGIAAHFGRVNLGDAKMPLDIVEKTGYKTPKGNDFRLTVDKDGGLAVHKEAWRNIGKTFKPRLPGTTARTYPAGQHVLPDLAGWVASPENPFVGKTAVNRLWAHFFARGLLHPLDDFHEGNEPSHPELLRMLSEEFTRSHQDRKHLIRCICASEAYQRTSRPVEGNAKAENVQFARMPLKTLTAEMLLESLGRAYDEPELFPRVSPRMKRGEPPAFLRADFIRLFNTNDPESGDPTDFTQGIPQVLHMLNVPLYNAGGKLVPRLLEKDAKPSDVIERLYLGTLSRRPTPAELKRKLALVEKHGNVREGLNGVLWTLVNSSEFAVNH